jgi:hypothetical protein
MANPAIEHRRKKRQLETKRDSLLTKQQVAKTELQKVRLELKQHAKKK